MDEPIRLLRVGQDGKFSKEAAPVGAGLPDGGTVGQVIKRTAGGGVGWGDDGGGNPLRDLSFYVAGTLIASPVPARFIIPSGGVRVDSIYSTIDVAGAGGSTVVKVLAGAAEVATITYAAGSLVPTISLEAANLTLAPGTFLRLAVLSVPATPPKDLSVSVWWK